MLDKVGPERIWIECRDLSVPGCRWHPISVAKVGEEAIVRLHKMREATETHGTQLEYRFQQSG